MAYRAEIEIGVKGQQKLKQLQDRVKDLSFRADALQEIFDNLVPDRALQSVNNYESVLKSTVQTLRSVEIATNDETEAIQKHVQAMGEANEVRERQNRLIREQVRAQAEAKAAEIAERTGARTQYASPIGPASAKEMDAVYASLTKLQERAINQANEFTEAIGRGTQEVYDLQAAVAKVQGPKLPVGFDAEQKAAEVRTRLAEDQSIKEINARRQVVREVLSEQIDADLKASQQRLKSNDEVFKDLMAKDKEYHRDWSARLKRRTQQRKEANKQSAASRKSNRDAISSAIIGGAFPLLFGQGPLAALGGAAGGFAGGKMGGQFGFGLSLVGTQIGAVASQIVVSASELGQALNPLTADLDKIAEAAGFAGTETELYIKAIEKNAGKQAALKAATGELAAVVGQDGVAALQRFGQASTDLGNAFNQLMSQMSAGIAKALGGVTEGLAENISRSAALNAGLGRTDGPVGDLNKERAGLVAKIGKGTSSEQIATNKRIRQINEEIIALVQKENRERARTLRLTADIQKKLSGIKDQQSLVQTQLEVLDITEKATTASTEASELRKRATEFIARQEERLASIRISLEQQVSSIRLQNLSKEAQLRNTQDQLELVRLRNRLKQASQAFAASINLQQPGRDFAISLNKAADDFKLALAKADADRAANARTNALELERLGVQAEQTKGNITRQVAKLKADFEKKSAELNLKVTEYNKKVSENRFKLEQQITKLQLDRIAAETTLLRLKLEAQAKDNELTEKQKTYFTNITKAIENARTAVNEQAAPSQIAPIDLGSVGGVSTEDFDSVIDQARTLIQRLSEAQGQLISEEVKSASIEFTGQLLEQTQALVEQRTPLDDRLETMERTAEVARLVAEGFSQADATAIVEGTQAFANLDEQLTFARENLITLLDGFLALEDKSPEIAEAIKEIQEALGKIEERLEGNKKGVNDFVNSFDKTDKIKEHIKSLDDELKDVQGMVVELAQTVESELSSAMSNAIVSVVTGTGTVQEAMSTMFANIGKAFIDMATQMIAKALVMKALGILFPGGNGNMGGQNYFDPITGKGVAGPNFGLANGGPTRPNGTYLVGEQGPELLSMGNQPGYVHRNTSEVMDRYRNGGNQGGTAANLSVNYNVTDINGMRFVTEDQFRAGMTKAAKDGAKMGEAGTFKTMKNSRSSRARVGL